jgi:hypothetical protein
MRWRSTSAGSVTSSSRPPEFAGPPDLDFDIGLARNVALDLSHHGATLASEMDAAVWTAIGLLAATSLGTLFYLGSRIDALSARMDARFAQIDARFDRVDIRFDRVDSRFDHMEERFDALAARLDAHLDRHPT